MPTFITKKTLVDIIAHFERFTVLEWIIFGFVSNLVLYGFSIALYTFIDRTCQKQKIQQENFPIKTSDIYSSLLTVLLNSVVMLIAVYLWKMGWIVLRESSTLLTSIAEIICIILVMDLLMFVFHYLAHLPFVYKLLHHKHHQHSSTNCLSLFVLHPLETLGFGLMMIMLFLSYDFSLISISVYLFVNLIWGTIGHLNREFFPSRMDRLYVGTTKFHNKHHVNENCNFGFYTSIWDRLFRTFQR